jgi:sugar (pentulose or hexulose) kinase
MDDLICVFDCGTTGSRTILFDIKGKEIIRAYEEYPSERQPAGISEQDPIIWWNAIKNTCSKVTKSSKINVDDIIGIAATFHRATTTIIDKDLNVLHPALTWMDEREVSDIKEFQEEGGLRRAIPKILWFKNNKPDLFNKAFKIIFPDTYIYMKLSGKIITDPSNAIFGILNMEDTLKWDEKLADLYELPVSLWPEIHEPGTIIGELSSETADILGLKKNLPIVMGGGDQQCSALGLGVIENGQAKCTTGTGTFVDMVVDKPVEVTGDIPLFSLPHVVKGKWVVEGTIPGTGTALKWFRDNFSQLQVRECKEAADKNIYDELISEAADIPIGSEGLLFVPLYVFRKGTIHGLSFNHTRGHFIRAIMESAALSAQMYLSLIEGVVGVKTSEIKVDGGATNSDLWCQIFADVIMKDILVPEVKDGAALGAGILGFFGCEKYSKIDDAVENMVKIIDKKTPNKENKKTYKKLMRIFAPVLLETLNNKRVTRNL